VCAGAGCADGRRGEQWYPKYLEDQHVAPPSWLEGIGTLEVHRARHAAIHTPRLGTLDRC
jgi:hypothetical protein